MTRDKSPFEFRRTDRINRALREELSGLIRREVRDPRVGVVTIVEVETSEDLRHAKVFYTVLETSPERRAEIQEGLDHAAPYLRRLLGKSLHLRRIPELAFHLDMAIEHGAQIEAVLRKIRPEKEDETP